MIEECHDRRRSVKVDVMLRLCCVSLLRGRSVARKPNKCLSDWREVESGSYSSVQPGQSQSHLSHFVLQPVLPVLSGPVRSSALPNRKGTPVNLLCYCCVVRFCFVQTTNVFNGKKTKAVR